MAAAISCTLAISASDILPGVISSLKPVVYLASKSKNSLEDITSVAGSTQIFPSIRTTPIVNSRPLINSSMIN